MTLDRYRLLARVGNGPDGLAFEACDEATSEKVIVRLLGAARREPRRWSRLQRRARLAQLFNHQASLRFKSVQLTAEQAFVVHEPFARSVRDLARLGAHPVE